MSDYIKDTSGKGLFYDKEQSKHVLKFGVKPVIIGMFWQYPNTLKDNIIEAIKNNKPYNEYELLSKDEQKDFDNGALLF